MTFYSMAAAGYGFETAKSILGISSNALNKLIGLGAIAVIDSPDTARNQLYAGWDIEYLTSARNRYLTLERPEQLALVCTLTSDDATRLPSLYVDEWYRRRDLMNKTESALRDEDKGELWTRIAQGEIHVAAHWRVSDADSAALAEHGGVILASYAGFILDGGVVIDWSSHPDALSEAGGRTFFVRPFTAKEKWRYTHTYLAPQRGPAAKTYTHDELATAAANQAALDAAARAR